MPRLSVFPMNPIAASVRKGEMKIRYFNPDQLFDHIQIVCPGSDAVPDDAVRPTVGKRASFELTATGWLDRMSWRQFARLRAFLEAELERMLPAVAAARPDIIRTYSPQIPGWFAVAAARRLHVPVVVSVHGDYDHDLRELSLRRRKFRQFMSNFVQGLLLEREVISSADLVICAYQFPVNYARRYGAKRVEVVYNRVDLSRFAPVARSTVRPFTILSVGRLVDEKNHSDLIRAMPYVDGQLRIIGDGSLYEDLALLAQRLGVGDRVSFERSIPHARIHLEYQLADVYASATRYGGIHIPILEAMASGLPLVVPRPTWEPAPELVADIAIVVDGGPEAFADALNRLRANAPLREQLGQLGRARAMEVDGARMEAKERYLYAELLSK